LTLDPHIIRLRGPWQLEPVRQYIPRPDGGYDDCNDDLPAATKATLPADWSEAFGADFWGVVRYRRTFRRPTNLEPHQRVWLVVEPPRSLGTIRLNGQTLGVVCFGAPAGRFDVTGTLADANALQIDVAHPELDGDGVPSNEPGYDAPGGLVGAVQLEIEHVE
jgi:hypothetical protein